MATTARDRIARVLLDYQIVSGAESRVANSVDRTRAKFRQLANEVKATEVPFAASGRAAQTLGNRLRGTVAPASDEAAAAMRRLREDALRANQALDAVSGASGGGFRNRLRGLSVETLGREIVGLPSVQLGPISSNDLGQGLRLAGQQGATFSGIAAAMAPVVAIAAPLAAGFIALEHSLSGSKRTLDAAVLANQHYYEMIAQGATSIDVATQIERSTAALAAAQAELASLETASAQAFSNMSANAGTGIAVIDDIGARTLTGLINLTSADDAFSARIEELRTTIFNLQADIARMTGALEAGDLAAADAAAALERAAEKAEMFAAAMREVDEIEARRNLELKRTAMAAQEAAQAEVALAKAKSALAIQTALELNDALTRLEQDASAKRVEAAYDLDNALSEAQRDADNARAEEVRKSGIQTAKLEEDLAAERQRIIRRSNATIANAIGARDALAAFLALQNRKEELADLQDEGDRRRRELDAQYVEQNRAIDMRLQEQNRQIRRRYDDQLRTTLAAYNTAVEAERRKHNALLGIQTWAANAQTAVAAEGAKAVVDMTGKMFAAIAQQVPSMTGPIAGKTPFVPPATQRAGQYIPRFDTGGYVSRTGLAMVHAGEYVINPMRGQGNSNINIYLDGESYRAMSVQETLNIIGRLMRRQGAA